MFPLKYPNYAFHKMLYNLQDLKHLVLFIKQLSIKQKNIIEQFSLSIRHLFHNYRLYIATEQFHKGPKMYKEEYKEKFCLSLLDSIQGFCLARPHPTRG
jgi:hypothetical protein